MLSVKWSQTEEMFEQFTTQSKGGDVCAGFIIKIEQNKNQNQNIIKQNKIQQNTNKNQNKIEYIRIRKDQNIIKQKRIRKNSIEKNKAK